MKITIVKWSRLSSRALLASSCRYPDTTAFYTAIVSQAPRRGQTGMEPTVMVQFQGDADSDGQTPNRTILLKHTFRALVVS